ncbi:MAG: glycosyltransferase family 2 protein [Lachnospiraceae bacterium]|nr:glycosyltransferase family 2 protein [Lachnospiraceae bacterium]
MEKSVKVSIIMPVYKVEEYVGKAIESIQAQTLTDWEFLIVDDGTPDKSGEICDAYAKDDKRITVIHKENGGAPSARNVAIDIAKGEYIYFMDSDDWAEPTMLEDMYNLAVRDNAQLVVSGFYIDTYYGKGKYITDEYYVDETVFPNRESFRKNAYKLFDKNQLYSPWNKLFEAKYIMDNNLRFPTTFWDDFPFVLDVIKDIERVTVTSKCYYHFLRARTESETAAYRPGMYEKREEEHGWMMELYKGWHVGDSASIDMIARRYLDRFIGCIENVTNPKCELTKKEKKAEIGRMLQNPRLDKMLEKAKTRSLYMKIMLLPIRWKNVTLTYMEAKFITFVKNRNTKLFTKLKVGR